jgi:hypothetical protein
MERPRVTIDAADNGLAIDDEPFLPVLQRSLYDPRKALRPVVT